MKQWKIVLVALLVLACAAVLPAMAEGLESVGDDIFAAPADAAVAEQEELALAPQAEDGQAAVSAAPGEVALNDINFPDAAFRAYLAETFDKDGKGVLDEGDLQATKLDVGYLNIASLKGIEFFTQLTVLYCDNNALTSLDLSQNPNLTKLACYNNALTSLDLSQNPNLTELVCHNNALTSLDLSQSANLTYLDCSTNQLTQIDLSVFPALERFIGSNNRLTSLNAFGLSHLEWLKCENNALSYLEISGCDALASLNCENNQLTELRVAGYPALDYVKCGSNLFASLSIDDCPVLTEIDCGNCRLTSLTVNNLPKLKRLVCSNNLLTSINILGCPDLNLLNCDHNQLAGTLDVGAFTLNQLDCSYNQLTGLNVTMTRLEYLLCQHNLMTALELKGVGGDTVDCLYKLDCSGNRLTRLTLDGFFYWLKYMYIQDNQLDEVDLVDCYDMCAVASQHTRQFSEDGKYITFINDRYVYNEDGTLFDRLAGDCLVSDVTTSVYWGSRLLYQGKPRDISKCTATISAQLTYNGSERKPAVQVVYNGQELVRDTDYTVSYTDNVNAGTATAVVTGTGRFGGTLDIPFQIKPRSLSAAKAKALTKTYTGKYLKPVPTLTYKGRTLVKGTDFTITAYADNRDYGQGTITVAGTGNFTGIKTVAFRITPKPTEIVDFSTGKGQLSVTWAKRTSRTTGYQVQYGLKSSFSGAKTVTVKNTKATRKVIKNLVGGKTYYVRVRTFARINGKNHYSAWCNSVKLKTKK